MVDDILRLVGLFTLMVLSGLLLVGVARVLVELSRMLGARTKGR